MVTRLQRLALSEGSALLRAVLADADASLHAQGHNSRVYYGALLTARKVCLIEKRLLASCFPDPNLLMIYYPAKMLCQYLPHVPDVRLPRQAASPRFVIVCCCK